MSDLLARLTPFNVADVSSGDAETRRGILTGMQFGRHGRGIFKSKCTHECVPDVLHGWDLHSSYANTSVEVSYFCLLAFDIFLEDVWSIFATCISRMPGDFGTVLLELEPISNLVLLRGVMENKGMVDYFDALRGRRKVSNSGGWERRGSFLTGWRKPHEITCFCHWAWYLTRLRPRFSVSI